MLSGFFDLIHAAYDLELPVETWFDNLAEHAARIVPGQGTVVYAYDASRPDEGVEFVHASRRGISDEFYEATLELNQKTRPEEARAIYHRGVCSSTVSEVMESDGGMSDSTYATLLGSLSPDTWGLSASDPTHRGIAMNSPLDEATKLDARTRTNWMRVGVHLNAAWRLRRRFGLRERCEQPETLDTNDARSVGLEDVFTRATRQAEHVRQTRLDGAPEEALSIWNALLDGRWTLVDRADTRDSRHYLLIENDYGLTEPAGLTRRERDVVAHIVQGESYKWIAFQLGVSTGTVSSLLARAMAKLGVGSRRELIWLFQQLQNRD